MKRALVGMVLVGSTFAMLANAVAAAGQYPLVLSATAEAKRGSTTVTSTVTVRVDALMTPFNRTRVTDGLTHGGYPGFLKALRAAPVVGAIETDSGRVDIRYAVEEPSEKGRRLVLVADRPLFFFSFSPQAKARAGYELTVAQLLLDDASVGSGTLSGAARVKPSPETGVILDNYSDTLVQLTVRPRRP